MVMFLLFVSENWDNSERVHLSNGFAYKALSPKTERKKGKCLK